MTTPQLHRWHQLAAQSTDCTAGIASNHHAPEGWDNLWSNPLHGFPALSDLSAANAPIVFQNWTGQIPGHETECLVRERPEYFIDGMVDGISKYRGDVILHCGSPHTSKNWDNEKSLRCIYELAHTTSNRKAAGFRTIWCHDAGGECILPKYGTLGAQKLIHWMSSLADMGFENAIEGGIPTSLFPIVGPMLSMQVMIHSVLVGMTNDPNRREGISPLLPETIVWVNKPKDGSVQASVDAATVIRTKGVPVYEGGVLTGAVAMDEFQKSAARPMSAAISCTQDKQDVQNTWPNKGGVGQ